jgi:hypothetical protein
VGTGDFWNTSSNGNTIWFIFPMKFPRYFSGWWYTYPSEKICVRQLRWLFPTEWKNKSNIWKVIKVMF